MSNKLNTLIISAVGIVFLFSAIAFGKTDKVNVLYPSMVGKTLKLQPGNYKVDIVNNKKSSAVKFYNRNGKLVGQVPVKLVNEARRNHQTQVDYNTVASNDHSITEIRLRGWKDKMYFSKSNAKSSGAAK